jgi:hypothetical protein
MRYGPASYHALSRVYPRGRLRDPFPGYARRRRPFFDAPPRALCGKLSTREALGGAAAVREALSGEARVLESLSAAASVHLC